MPPAFNLSQDQTLQFDLECLLIGIDKVLSISEKRLVYLFERLKGLATLVLMNLAIAFKRPRLSAVCF